MFNFLPEGNLIDTKENKAALSSIQTLNEAAAKETVLEARALVCDQNHNLIVDLGCIKGIIPRFEGAVGIAEGTVRDIAIISKVGKPVCFTVTAITTDESGEKIAVLSRRRAQELCVMHYISTLTVGDIIEATVTHLEPFGAFCDIGCGIASLLPIDSISVSRISHPCDRFSPGDRIRAVIKSIENGRITLSHKELLGTWEENAEMFSAGQTVSGVIRSVEDYGIFVEITPNLAGLAEPRENVKIGQQASVYIKSIIKEKMKIKLIIIDNFESSFTPEIKYFYNENRIENWEYSPINCQKKIFTKFCG